MRCGKHICSGAYANNVKCMHSIAPDCTADCSEFILGICTGIVFSYLHTC